MYELRNEIFIFLKEENHALATTFEDEVFLTQSAYLCDIFNANVLLGFTFLEGEQFFHLTSDLTLKSIYNPSSLISFLVKGSS